MITAIQRGLVSIIGLFNQPPKPPHSSAPIRYASFIKIFQFFNNELYETEDNIPVDDDNIQNLALIIKGLNSPTYEHLIDSDRTKVTLKSEYMRKDAASITFLEYTHTAIEVGDEKWASIIISTKSITDNTMTFIPQFSMSGRYKLHPHDGTRLFYPEHTMCLIKQDTKDAYYAPINVGGLQAALLYAHDVFQQLIKGNTIDPLSNQAWILDKSRYSLIPQKIAELIGHSQKPIENNLET